MRATEERLLKIVNSWKEAGCPDQDPSFDNPETAQALLEFVRDCNAGDMPCFGKGYGYPLEIGFCDVWSTWLCLAIDCKEGRLNVFEPTDVIGPNLLSIHQGREDLNSLGRDICKAVTNLVQDSFGLLQC